ncbi:MAG TPA: hypothetical protein PLE45_10055 [Spirochaetota bacterium]|nr:hypothetical protein [Spirochaetota bacterium]HOL57542.1 hypothetical protein [Spirochaetota bacterium]HPP05074.1 hypothetical protein [Spirochaetota bacterium]
MITPKIKYIIISILIIIFSVVLFLPVIVKYYDKNYIINTLEQKFKKSKAIKDKIFILNIENRIDSSTFLNTLYLLNDMTLDSVFIDINFRSISDSTYLESIKNFINENKKFYGFILLEDKKGIKFLNRNYSNNDIIQKNFTYLKTQDPFLYASYLKDIKIDNIFQIAPEKIGFIVENKKSRSNLDIIYKFDNKFLLSLPFIKSIYDQKIDIKNIEFNTLDATFNKKKIIRYDQKGRASFLHNISSKPEIITNSFIEWNDNITNRSTIIENLLKLKLIETKSTNFEGYKYDENVIDNIYNVPEFKNFDDNNLLSITKEISSQWKSFKNFKKDLLTNSMVFIVDSGNFDFVNNFITELNIIKNGKNLNRLPIVLFYIIIVLIIAGIFIINIFTKKFWQTLIINSGILVLNLSLFFILRLFLNTDYIFNIIIIVYLWTSILSFVLKLIENRLWIDGVNDIYKSQLNLDYTKKIAKLWKENRINFNPQSILTTFMLVDISTLVDKETSEENIDTIGRKTLEIENIIKNNYGIISSVTPSYILGYFGNPEIQESKAVNAIESARSIEKLPIILETGKHYLTIAIHSKYEWFKFIKKGNINFWTHFGTSLKILSEMVEFAKKFGISIIISENTFKQCDFKLPVRMITKMKVEGINDSIRLFELLTQENIDKFDRLYDYFHAGLKLFESRKWNEASQYFRQCLKINENDKVSKIYLEKCKEFISSPPSEEWDGIIKP